MQLPPVCRQVGATPHVPLLQVSPLQHWLLPVQLPPVCLQVGATPHVPLLQVSPLQHWLFPVQLPPVGLHVVAVAQKPLLLHVRPEQHPFENEEHSCPPLAHVGAVEQYPPEHESPAQHGDDAEQVWFEARHTVPPPLA